MRESVNGLIERLSREANAVKPLRPPLLRALAFLLVLTGAMVLAVFWSGDWASIAPLFARTGFMLDVTGAWLAGIGALIAAVMISIPGRSENWVWLPVPGLALWMIGGGIECAQDVSANGWAAYGLFDFRACFQFILTASAPVALAVFLLLRATTSIHLGRVTALAGISASMFAAVLLQFFHAHPTNPMDFVTHVVAIGVVLALMMTLGRRGLA